MISNLDRYKKDLDALLKTGGRLMITLQHYCYGAEFEKQIGQEALTKLAKLPKFKDSYQAWYSEALAVVKQLLPDRLADFVRHYEKPKSRKDITFDSYRIEDCLQGITVTQGYHKDKVVGPDGAIPHFEQQLAILRAVNARFESSLFDIRQLVQADLFDSELDAAGELLKQKFLRAAGALAGVVLERHLSQVCANHTVKVPKKDPAISDLNDALKAAVVIDVAGWRFIQHLGDIRNLCDHDKKQEPSAEQVKDLIAGVLKVIKTTF